MSSFLTSLFSGSILIVISVVLLSLGYLITGKVKLRKGCQNKIDECSFCNCKKTKQYNRLDDK